MTPIVSTVFFILITIGYFFLKSKPTTINEFATYNSSNNTKLIIYFCTVVFIQLSINIGAMSSLCGGSIQENIASAFIITIIPWILIFGCIIIVLIIFPGFKSAFSNVIGYFIVAGSANKILTDLLLDVNTDSAISKVNPDEQGELRKAADIIVKICGNTALMINQIVPENFIEYWTLLTPLFKKSLSPEEINDKQLKLFHLVITRDNIGEILWYIYTGVLLISIVQYNIISRGCTQSLATMAVNHQKFLDEEELQNQNTQAANNTAYIG